MGCGAVVGSGEEGPRFAEEEEGAAEEDGPGVFRKAVFGELQGFSEGGEDGAGRRTGSGDEGLRVGWWEDARRGHRGEYPFADDGGEEGKVVVDGFVRRGGEDADGFAVAEGGSPRVEQGVHGVRVVCAVHDDAGADFLESAGPLDVPKPVGDVPFFDAEVGEFGERGDGHAGVFKLVRAG